MAVEVIYCYRCGKHVKRDGNKCWYCSATTRRVIRPPRKCSFCDEEIGHKAVKCPHCGEFLDGRPKNEQPQADKPPLQIFYVIDKALIQGDRPLMLRGGETVPPEVARSLTHRTLEAIHSNNPQLVDQAGVRALPAPGARSSFGAIDAELVESDSPVADSTRLIDLKTSSKSMQAPNIPVRRQEGKMAPAADQTWSGQMTRALVRGAGYALTQAGHTAYHLIKGAESEPEAKPQPPVSSGEDRYLTCKFCQTETLRGDNYCFHCGSMLGSEAVKPKLDATRMMSDQTSNSGLLIFAAAIAVGLILLKMSGLALGDFVPGGEWIAPALTGFCPLLLLRAYFRRRTFLTALLVLLLGALWLGAAFYSFS